jgi:hypothetical protein
MSSQSAATAKDTKQELPKSVCCNPKCNKTCLDDTPKQTCSDCHFPLRTVGAPLPKCFAWSCRECGAQIAIEFNGSTETPPISARFCCQKSDLFLSEIQPMLCALELRTVKAAH